MITNRERLLTKKARNEIDRFETFILKSEDGCWHWDGATHPTGAGKFSLCPKGFGQTLEYGHRVAYRIYHGPIPKGRYVVHTCQSNDCVNPDHLVCATSEQWGRLQALLERAAHGSKVKGAKLTEELVRWTREQFAAGEMDADQLASALPVTKGSVHRILRGDRWIQAGGPIQACRQRKGISAEVPDREVQLEEMLAELKSEGEYAVSR